jgi:hypothetical protein
LLFDFGLVIMIARTIGGGKAMKEKIVVGYIGCGRRGRGVLKNDVFSGETAQKITVAGTLEYWNITGASVEGTGTKTEKE